MYNAETARKEVTLARNKLESVFIEEDLTPLYDQIKYDANEGRTSSFFQIIKPNKTELIFFSRIGNVPDLYFKLSTVKDSFRNNGFEVVGEGKYLNVGWDE